MKKILIAASVVSLISQAALAAGDTQTTKSSTPRDQVPLLSQKGVPEDFFDIPTVIVDGETAISEATAPSAPKWHAGHTSDFATRMDHFYSTGEEHQDVTKLKNLLACWKDSHNVSFRLAKMVAVKSRDSELREKDMQILSELAQREFNDCPHMDASLNSRKQRRRNRKAIRKSGDKFVIITVNADEAQQLDKKRFCRGRSRELARVLAFQKYCEKKDKTPITLVGGAAGCADIKLQLNATKRQYAKRIWFDKQQGNLLPFDQVAEQFDDSRRIYNKKAIRDRVDEALLSTHAATIAQ